MKYTGFKLSTLFLGVIVLACASTENTPPNPPGGYLPEMIKRNIEDALKSGSIVPYEKASHASIKFIKEATVYNLVDLEAGGLAKEQALSDEVKSFAELMISNRTQASNELLNIIKKKKLSLPQNSDLEYKNQIKPLYQLKGTDFDKAYMNLMESNLNKVLELYRKNSSKAIDADLKAYASKQVSALKTYTESAARINSSLKNSSAQ